MSRFQIDAKQAGDRAALAHLIRRMEARRARHLPVPGEWLDEAARLRAAIYAGGRVLPAEPTPELVSA